MTTPDPRPWEHDHRFGQHHRRPGELRTLVVIALTVVTMVVEIAAGIAYGSMALLADGLHMASHAAALGIAALAYVYARRHAGDPRYSFGSGKINALGGYTGAVLLAIFSVMMAWESLARLVAPVEIAFNQAILVAVLGLLVNGVSALVLSDHHHDEGHHHGESHHGHGEAEAGDEHPHDLHGPEPHGVLSRDHDHNLRAAYFHVLADALTSLLAIFALLAGKYGGWTWMDPAMGLVGATLVARWSLGLIRSTAHTLLDRQAPAAVRDALRDSLQAGSGDRVEDLHVWSIGPGIYAAELVVVTRRPQPPEYYKRLIPPDLGVLHTTVEVHTDRA